MKKTCILFLLFLVPFGISSYLTGPGPGIKETSWTMDGDGYTSSRCSLEIKTNDFKSHYYAKGGINVTEDGSSMGVYVCGKNNINAQLPFAGFKAIFLNFDSIGTYTFSDTTVSFKLFFKKESTHEEYDRLYLPDGDGSITISRYDKVGGLIEGTFSGEFSRLSFDTKSGIYTENDDIIKITDGKFSVVRFPDLHWNKPRSTGDEPPGFKEKENNNQSL